MEWLDEAQIDAKYAVPASKIFTSNILASPGWVEVGNLWDFDWEYNVPASMTPKLFGPVGGIGVVPKILLLGNSHMKMYGPTLRKLADEYQTPIAFATKDGFWLEIGWRDVGKALRPRISMLGDFWSGAALAGVYTDTFDWAGLFDDILQFSDKLIVLGDIPAAHLCCDGEALLKNEVYKKGLANGNYEFLTNIQEHPECAPVRLKVETAIQATLSLPRFAGRTSFIKMDKYFQTMAEPPMLQLVDPVTGGLIYRDPSHLNADGARRAEQVFRKELFGQPTC